MSWEGELRFKTGGDHPPLILDSAAEAGPSPMQALGYAIIACMGMDVVHILKKGRHDLQGLDATFHGIRAEEHPRRFTRVELRFLVRGNVPAEAADRAIALSRDTYCSVWNSIAPDTEFDVTATVASAVTGS